MKFKIHLNIVMGEAECQTIISPISKTVALKGNCALIRVRAHEQGTGQHYYQVM